MATNLMLHCGAREVTRDELNAVPCPIAPEGSRWRPVPHGQVLDYALTGLTDAGYGVETMRLALTRDDQRFFGTLSLQSPLVSGVSLAVGIRSSLDKSLALQWACGSHVFVCDNLAFQSEKVISRKHTTHGVERYQEAICLAVSDLKDFRAAEAGRITRMQTREIDDREAEATLLRLYQDEQILSPRSLPVALKEWRQPSFAGLKEKTLWRLFNAITYSLGKKVRTNPQAHAAATIRVGALLAPEAPETPAMRQAAEAGEVVMKS